MSKDGSFNRYPLPSGLPSGGNMYSTFPNPYPPYQFSALNTAQDNIRPENFNIGGSLGNVGGIITPKFNDRNEQNFRPDINVSTPITTSASSATGVNMVARQDNLPQTQKPETPVEKPFVCTICNKRFAENRNLKKHELIHSEEKSFICKICNMHFIEKFHLKKHQLTHLDERIAAFKANNPKPVGGFGGQQHQGSQNQVGNPTGQQQDGIRHTQGHMVLERPGSVNSLSSHQSSQVGAGMQSPGMMSPRTEHQQMLGSLQSVSPQNNHLRCRVCGRGFNDSKALLKHELTHLKPYKCRVCDKEFARSQSWREHEQMHLDPLKCSICDKTFTRQQGLKEHEHTHLEAKPYKCSVCGSGYTTKRSCKRHEQDMHKLHGERKNAGMRYKCMYCEKEFSRSNTLKEHELCHTMEKPFQCSICGTGYTTKSSRNRHEYQHKKALGLL